MATSYDPTHIIPQTEDVCQVQADKLTNVNMTETLALADLCLEKYNEARAKFVATGDAAAFREALALERDRAALLGGEVGR